MIAIPKVVGLLSSLNTAFQCDLHLGAIGEISCWNSVLLLDLGENDWKLVDQIVLLVLFAENSRHLLLQIADDVCMGLRERQGTYQIQQYQL